MTSPISGAESNSAADDVIDAELVDDVSPAGTLSAPESGLAPDYSDAGVPSLDYLRDRIEGRYATAIGSTELAEAAAAREAVARAARESEAAATAELQRAAREQAAKDKLDEIRRSLHPGTGDIQRPSP